MAVLTSANRVKETTTTTGTGTYSLAGAVTGFQGFVAGVGTTKQCFYCVTNDTDWEVGLGTVTDATPDTLSRDAILESSNAGAAVNWGAGSKTVFVTGAAQHLGIGTQSVTAGTGTVTLGATSPTTVLVGATGAYTLALPAVGVPGRRFKLLFGSDVSNTNRVTLDADGAETIDGGLTLLVCCPYTQCELVDTGTEWRVASWVPGLPVTYVVAGSLWTTNTTITARLEQPEPRKIKCSIVYSLSGAPDTAALKFTAAPPGFAIDETNDVGSALYPTGWFVGTVYYLDASVGWLHGVCYYATATDDITVMLSDDAAAATFYLVSVTQAIPVTMANGDRFQITYTIRVT